MVSYYLLKNSNNSNSINTISGYLDSALGAKKVEQNFEILYTKDGFSPNFLDVPLGATINFKNQSGIPLWTASDPHPTHMDYPEFDAKKDYRTGEIYSFKFTKTGTFGFHNHEDSLHRGFIKVTDITNPLPSIDKTKESQRAVRDKFLAILKPGDVSSVYKLMDAIESNTLIANDCHDMAHDWGHKAYELYGFSGAMTFNDPNHFGNQSTDDICAGGYMHGIVEELFLHQPELKKNPENICAPIPNDNRGSCFHGVGHSLMFVNKRDVKASLETCQDLPVSSDAHRCYEGVWMEMFWGLTDHGDTNTLGWDASKPLEPCQNAQLDQKPACFLYAHLGYLRIHHKDFSGAVNLCLNNGLTILGANFCIKGVGITMLKHVTSHHLEQTEDLVQALNNEQKTYYYEGVIGYARISSVSE